MTSDEATAPGDRQAFQELSFGEKWRVARLLAKGEAPPDPRMAATAIELAESYQRQGRGRATLARWLPAVVIVVGEGPCDLEIWGLLAVFSFSGRGKRHGRAPVAPPSSYVVGSATGALTGTKAETRAGSSAEMLSVNDAAS